MIFDLPPFSPSQLLTLSLNKTFYCWFQLWLIGLDKLFKLQLVEILMRGGHKPTALSNKGSSIRSATWVLYNISSIYDRIRNVNLHFSTLSIYFLLARKMPKNYKYICIYMLSYVDDNKQINDLYINVW